MASRGTGYTAEVTIVNANDIELEQLGYWGCPWSITPHENIAPKETRTYLLNSHSKAGIWYRALDAATNDELGFVNMAFICPRIFGNAAEGTHWVNDKFISSGLQTYSGSATPLKVKYLIGEDNQACWQSGSTYNGKISCEETTFNKGRAWIRIHNVFYMQIHFSDYWNDNKGGSSNWYWEPSSKDVPKSGNTRTVILKNNDRAGLSFRVSANRGFKFTNLSFTSPKLSSNSAEGSTDDDFFISPGLQKFEDFGTPVYFRYELGTPNLACWYSGTYRYTGSIVCRQTEFCEARNIISNADKSPTKPKPNDRVFIMIGRVCAGKSTLGNLLLGEENFIASKEKCGFSTTILVKHSETVVPIGLTVDPVKFKVIDQPGMGDPKFNFKIHCENLIECLKDLNVKTFPTFLLVINLESVRASEDHFLLVAQFSELLSNASYSFFSLTVVVFTHFKPDTEATIEYVERKFTGKGWGEISDILEAVDHRYIFVNTTINSPGYRNTVRRQLFELSKPTLNIRFHGNDDFSSHDIMRCLKITGDVVMQQPLYKLNLHFHQDLDLYRIDKMRMRDGGLNQQIERAIESMIALGEGVSAMVLLISLEDLFSENMYDLILDLPRSYIAEDDPKFEHKSKDWWKYVFIVFKVPDEDTAAEQIKLYINHNPKIKCLVEKVRNKWTWMTHDTPIHTCRDRLTEMCLSVRKDIGGKVFIQNTVIKELKIKLGELQEYKGKYSQVKLYMRDLQRNVATSAMGLMESGRSNTFNLGGMLLKQKVSVSTMMLILRSTRLNQVEIDRFRAKHKNPNEHVSFQEILHFFAEDLPADT